MIVEQNAKYLIMNTTFDAYYQENISAMENFAKKLTKNGTDAQDLVQETVIRAYRSFHTFKQGTSFKSWSFTIMKNTFITWYNKKKKKGVVNAPIEDFSYALHSKYTTKNNAESKLRVQEIISCIEELSYKSKLPFLMHIEGYQYNEIADALNIPMGTVKSRINYARTKLQKSIIKKGIKSAS